MQVNMSLQEVVTVLVLVVCLVSFTTCEDQDSQPKVTIKDGSEIVGIYEEFNSDELPAHAKLESYYGIPYAEPPVGDLRFKPPVAKGKLDSPFIATEIGKSCIQMDPKLTGIPLTNEEMSEDCLFLDVIVPHPKPEKAPVVFWIHGGGLTVGAGNMPYCGIQPTVAYSNVIAVTINYRLGAFGFLTTADDLIPGNIGLRDQQLALKWVNKNIEAFGGDPDRVTIAGASAGAGSAGLQMLSPGSSGLFKNVIMQSGSPFDMNHMYDRSAEEKPKVKALAKLVECPPEDIEEDVKLLKCLQNIPALEILDKIGQVGVELGDPMLLPPAPLLDGEFLPEHPQKLAEEGRINGENIIVGTNAEEGNMFMYGLTQDKEVKPVVNSTTFGDALSLLFGDFIDPALHDLIKMIYAPDPSVLLDESRDDLFTEASQFLGDKIFTCSHSQYARTLSKFVNVYRYTMTYVPSKNCMDIQWAGATHGDEVQYITGIVFDKREPMHTYREEEKDLSRKAMNYWRNFLRTGNPNTPDVIEDPSLPSWPKFTKGDELFKDLTPSMRNIRNMKSRECYFIDHVLPPLKEALKELQELKQKVEDKSKWTEEGQCKGEGCHHEDSPAANDQP